MFKGSYAGVGRRGPPEGIQILPKCQRTTVKNQRRTVSPVGDLVIQIMNSLLSGFKNAVMKFKQALARRYLLLFMLRRSLARRMEPRHGFIPAFYWRGLAR
jgi:hypothetical protein